MAFGEPRMINGIRRYNCWAGLPEGIPENLRHCIEEVGGLERWPSFHQCRRYRGYGKDGLYCKQHARIHDNAEYFKAESK